jgi:arginine decarboxylase
MNPTRIFFTRGIGHSDEKLISFENALREAQIACYNLVRVSSILPANCEEISVQEGVKLLTPGQIVYAVISEFTYDFSVHSREFNTFASLGIAKPKDSSLYGYLSEYSGINQPLEIVKKESCRLAKKLLESSRNEVEIKCDSYEITAYTKLNMTPMPEFITCIAAAVFIE